MKPIALCLAMLATVGAPAAFAQEAALPPASPEPPVTGEATAFDGDWLGVGVGAGYAPSYDGSDDYVVFPVPVLVGSVGGIGISPRAGGIALDLLDGVEQGRVSFSLGPAARLRASRSSQIKDPVVLAAGKLDKAFEIGPTAGVTVNGVLHDYDRLSLVADLRWDIAGAHRGQVLDMGVSYVTPLSRGAAAALSTSAVRVDSDFADYYYSVSPAQSAASGLPQFNADSGWHKLGANLALGFDLDGDFTNGGLLVALAGGYTRMLGDARRSPYTSLRGDADQWFAAAGVGYIF